MADDASNSGKASVDPCRGESLDAARWLVDSGRGEQPILFKVGLLGEHYRTWVHKPVKGRPRFLQSSLLEGITKTPWWVVPLIWGPVLICCLALSLSSGRLADNLALVASGLLLWQLMEYVIHRWVFHTIPENYWGITAHFLFHGCHHKYPMDATRLVFPPIPAGAVALGVLGTLRTLVPQVSSKSAMKYAFMSPKDSFIVQEGVLPLFTGIASGYLLYDCLHYFMHHGGSRGWILPLRRAHLHHHFKAPEHGFGISSPLLDVLLASGPP